jgi:hypothetical protein
VRTTRLATVGLSQDTPRPVWYLTLVFTGLTLMALLGTAAVLRLRQRSGVRGLTISASVVSGDIDLPAFPAREELMLKGAMVPLSRERALSEILGLGWFIFFSIDWGRTLRGRRRLMRKAFLDGVPPRELRGP